MPAIDERGRPIRRKRRPANVQPPRSADQGDPARNRPAQRPQPQPSFTRSPFEKPFTQQRREARAQTRRAERQLPRPIIAAPPVIRNPTPTQTRAAKAQIVRSVRVQLGNTHGAERAARTQALYDQIRTDPRMARVRRSIEHWQREDTKLTRPDPGYEAKAGRTHRRAGVGFATVDLTAGMQAARTLGARAAPGLAIGDAPGQFVRNAIKDVGTLGTAPFVAGATLASLGKDVVTGHPEEAAGRAVEMGKAVVEGVKQDWSHPGRYLVEHPVMFGLDVGGVTGIAGRGAGAIARAGGVERASTIRPPIALAEDAAGGLVERRGSKDLIRRELQAASDSRREQLRDAEGKPVTVEQGGREVPVLLPKNERERARLNKRRADTVAARANAQERLERDVVGKDMRVRGVRGKAAREITSMVAEGTILSAKTLPRDLANHARRIRGNLAQHNREVAGGQTPSVYRHEGEVEAAKRRAELAEKVLKSPKALKQAERIVEQGTEHGRRLVKSDTDAAAMGLFQGGPEQARRARLVTAAVEHMGARHGTDPRIDRRVTALKRNERSLQARLNFGHASGAERARIAEQLKSSRETRAALAARNTERLRSGAGDPLEPKEIERFLRARGRDPETVAYLPGEVNRKQFHKQFRVDSRGTLTTQGHVRTGEAHRKGATEASSEILRAAGVRHATTLTKAKNIDRTVREHGMIHPAMAKAARGEPLTKHEKRVVAAGGYYTGREAAEVIARAGARGERLVAVRALPAKLDSETQRTIRENLQGPGGMDALGQRLLNDRVITEGLAGHTARNVVLMNEDLVKRLQDHLQPSSSAGKMAQIANKAFRYAVLPQPRWLVGNFFEPLFVRMPGVGSGINVLGLGMDVAAGVRQMRHMERSSDPKVREAAAQIRAQQFGGLLFGNRGLTNNRGLEDFPALNTDVQKRYGRMVAKMPATRQLAQVTGALLKGGGKAIIAPLDMIFRINRLGEAGLQRAAFGKSVRREAQDFTRNWFKTVKLGEQAMADVAKGLVNTSTQQRFMSAQHELLGKYEGFSPALRRIIQGPAPFLPWALNAARFVYWTMPAHRTAQTALLVRLNDVVAKDWEEIHKNVPPGMGLAIPNGKGGWVDVARYTPYGLTGQISQGDFRGVTSQLFPQLSGTRAALEGKDPFGRDLQMSDRQPPGGGDKARIAANSALEAFVPYVSNARRLQEQGETAFADSTVFAPKSKPGTSHGMSAARRVLDPFRPTYLRAGGAPEVVSEPVRGSAIPGLPPAVSRALAQDQAINEATQLPESVQRALARIR